MLKTDNKQHRYSFKKERIKDGDTVTLYSDSIALNNSRDRTSSYGASLYESHEKIIEALTDADASNIEVIKNSRKLYAINPIYEKIVDYYSSINKIRYFTTPRFMGDKSSKKLSGEDWEKVYRSIIDGVDGLNLETVLPKMLGIIQLEGGVFFALYKDEDSNTLTTIILPTEYCRKIGQTQFNTSVISFNYQYFNSLGLTEDELKTVLKAMPPIMKDGYKAYKKSGKKWQALDPTVATCVIKNDKVVPNLLYTYGAILDYEQYMLNELDKNSQQLESLIVHKIPTYQDQLILEVAEMNALHKKLSKIVQSSTVKTRLMTTIGDVQVLPLQQTSTEENKTLEKSYKTIFDNVGLNCNLFYGSNTESIKVSTSINRGIMWQFLERIISFYNLAFNKNFDYGQKFYQAEIQLIELSRDNYDQDIQTMRENAKVGIGITQFIVASGIKQKNIESYLDMESNLDLVNKIKPLLSSNTTTAADLTPSSNKTDKEVGVTNETNGD